MVGGICSMLPYGTSICCYAYISHLIFFIASVHSFLYIPFLKSGIDKSTEWSTIPACPSLTCFFNRGNTEGTKSSKKFGLMSVCFVLYKFVSGLILWFLENLWFDDLCA